MRLAKRLPFFLFDYKQNSRVYDDLFETETASTSPINSCFHQEDSESSIHFLTWFQSKLCIAPFYVQGSIPTGSAGFKMQSYAVLTFHYIILIELKAPPEHIAPSFRFSRV